MYTKHIFISNCRKDLDVIDHECKLMEREYLDMERGLTKRYNHNKKYSDDKL